MLLRIKYNSNRFPRTIILKNHKTKVFHPDKKEIDFEEYDAYLLLKNNSRLKAEKWEFSIVGITDEAEKIVKEEIVKDKEVLEEVLEVKETKNITNKSKGKFRPRKES